MVEKVNNVDMRKEKDTTVYGSGNGDYWRVTLEETPELGHHWGIWTEGPIDVVQKNL